MGILYKEHKSNDSLVSILIENGTSEYVLKNNRSWTMVFHLLVLG